MEDGPWRLQELDNTEISGDLASDFPAYGRRYEIFYNQVKLGLLEIIAISPPSLRKTRQVCPCRNSPKRSSGYSASLSAGFWVLDHHRGLSDKHASFPMVDLRVSTNRYYLLFQWASGGDVETARDFTLTEQGSWFGDFTVRLDGTPDHYYHIEAHERAERKACAGGTGRRSPKRLRRLFLKPSKGPRGLAFNREFATIPQRLCTPSPDLPRLVYRESLLTLPYLLYVGFAEVRVQRCHVAGCYLPPMGSFCFD